MKNILFVSIAFPPKNDPECLQTAKYFKYLVGDKDLAVTVVTSASPTLFMPLDAELKKYDSGFDQKIELPIFETKLSNWILRKLLPNGIDFPDSKLSFHWQGNIVPKLLKKKPDLIYTRSNPLSSTFLGYKLKKYYNVPWVMHLSDPWADSPVHTFNKKQKEFHEKWELKCFNAADAVALTSIQTIQFYAEKYPNLKHKLHHFPNVFDAEDEQQQPLKFKEKLRIIYTGGLSGTRSPDKFIRACKTLIDDYPEFNQILDVTFAGPMDLYNRQFFISNKVSCIKHIGEISYKDALQLVNSAHLLLTIDYPLTDPKLAMYFPSKILDYFLAKRKIMALTTPLSATSHVLSSTNSAVVKFDDIKAIKDYLYQSILAFKNSDFSFFTLSEIPDVYSASTNAKKLSCLFKTL